MSDDNTNTADTAGAEGAASVDDFTTMLEQAISDADEAAKLSNGMPSAEEGKEDAQASDEVEGEKVQEEDAKDAATKRPEGIPEKFWDAEKGEVKLDAMAKAYRELEKKQSAEPPKEGEAPAAVDFSSFTEEFNTSGDVSEENRAEIATKLEATLGPKARELVDAYIEGAKARQEQARSLIEAEMFTVTGSKDNYEAMRAWALDALTESEIAEFNEAFKSGNKGFAKLAVKDLYARFQNRPKAPKAMLKGKADAKGGDASKGYANQAEMDADMDDVRYRTDPGFRRSVEAKIARTTSW